jgi:hypothetical protein
MGNPIIPRFRERTHHGSEEIRRVQNGKNKVTSITTNGSRTERGTSRTG